MKVTLEIIKGPERGKRFVLDQPTTVIGGRSPEARFHFSKADPYISRRHFLLELSPPRVYFRDLDVTNPSTVNDQPIDVAELADGDTIEIGYTWLKVSIAEDSPPATVQELSQTDSEPEPPPTVVRKPNAPGSESDASALALPEPSHLSIAISPPDAPLPPSLFAPSTPELPSPNLTIRCACGCDLSARANGDGRALELQDSVSYVCERCLPPAGEEAGRHINDYEVIRKLGGGGMGTVYLAYHRSTARLVAIKEMNIGNQELGARFNREIRLMRQVVHAHVTRYLDDGLDSSTGKPYLVLEYASQGSLQATMLANHGQLPIKESVHYAIQALRGLEEVHQRDIVHRDLKPENILLIRTPQGGVSAKISDFGLAREFSRAGGSILTKVGVGMGTLMYMPPEQICDAHNVRETADLYAVGVTLYQLLTGKHTFNFPTPFDVLQFLERNKKQLRSPEENLHLVMAMQRLKTPYLIILEDEPIPIQARQPAIPSALAEIVDKAVKKEIEQRFQQASDFRAQLEALVRSGAASL